MSDFIVSNMFESVTHFELITLQLPSATCVTDRMYTCFVFVQYCFDRLGDG